MSESIISQVVKYEGDNTTFVWKHPIEDFNSTTQLIVHQSQEAIFFMNGEALDLFAAGRYTLETQNIPMIRKIINIPTGGETPFHSEVYFVNKTEQMAIKWGTDSKVQFIEPTYQFPLQIGASGEMSLRIEDARKFLVKLVGTVKEFNQEHLMRYFRAILMTKIKSYIVRIIQDQELNIFEIDAHLTRFSDDIKARLEKDFLDYGVALERFFVTNIVKPDGDPLYENFKHLFFRSFADIRDAEIRQQVGVIDETTMAKRVVIESQGIAQKRNIEGYTYQQERSFDVSEKLAENEGSGNFSSAGIGLGMMTGIGGAVGGTVGTTFQGAMEPMLNPQPTNQEVPRQSVPSQSVQQPLTFCDNCGHQLMAGMMFCEECGSPLRLKPSCKGCGYTFEKPGKFCPKCGTKREE